MSGILITLLVRPGQKKSSELLFTEEPGYTSDHNMATARVSNDQSEMLEEVS